MRPIYYTKRYQRPRRIKPFIFLLFLGSLFIVIFFSLKSLTSKPSSENILSAKDQPSVERITPYPTLAPATPTPNNIITNSESLGDAVQNALIGTRGSYGIVIKNLKTEENYSFNEHVKYYSASLYKLWVMAEVYRQIKNGTIKEDEILSEKYETLNSRFRIDPKDAEIKEGTLTLSVKDALNKMITISDNYSALLLALKVRLSNVASFLKVNGFTESAVGTSGAIPTTTAYDIALFFEKLYKSELIDEEYSSKMLALLKAQRLNDKIPKNLPDNVSIAHKTGELDEYTHDVGIVYAENGDYVIVVLSKSIDPDLAENRISNVSESVYNYFSP